MRRINTVIIAGSATLLLLSVSALGLQCPQTITAATAMHQNPTQATYMTTALLNSSATQKEGSPLCIYALKKPTNACFYTFTMPAGSSAYRPDQGGWKKGNIMQYSGMMCTHTGLQRIELSGFNNIVYCSGTDCTMKE